MMLFFLPVKFDLSLYKYENAHLFGFANMGITALYY